MSPKEVVVIVDGGILSAILQVFTRYSANDPEFPVNDRSLFTGKALARQEKRPPGKALSVVVFFERKLAQGCANGSMGGLDRDPGG